MLKAILDQNIKKYILNIVYSVGAHVFGILISLVASVMMTRALGIEGRGVMSWILYFNVLGTSLAQLGMSQTGRRFVAEKPKHADDLTLITILVCFASSLIIIPVLLMIALQNGIGHEYFLALMISLVAIPFSAAAASIGDVLAGLGDGKAYSQNILLRKISSALMLFGLVIFKIATPLTGVAVAFISIMIRFINGLWLLKKHIHFKFINPKWVFKNLKLYTFFSYISFISILIARMIIPIELGLVSTKTQTGIYTSAVILIEAMFMLPQMIGMYLLPELSKNTDNKKWRKIFNYSFIGTFIVISGTVIFFYIIANLLIILLYGKEFINAIPVFRILLSALFFFALGTVMQSAISAKCRDFAMTIAPISAMLTSYISSKILINTFGAIGGAYALSLSMFVLFALSSVVFLLGTSRQSK